MCLKPGSLCVCVISWASKDVVWNNMLEKDKTYSRDVRMMENHPHLQPKMRAILLDWLMEVCVWNILVYMCLESVLFHGKQALLMVSDLCLATCTDVICVCFR